MPVYEYRCQSCQNRVGVRMSYAEYGVKPPVCPMCGGKNLKRLIGRVRIAKSEDRRLEDMSDPSLFGDVDENDPKSIGRALKKMGREMGEDLPPEFDEITARLEAGEDPEAIEKSMPELGGEGGGEDEE
ncbi:MAG TPA: zinc ribbon domain-containing protein [Anaerolineales bacterium]|nr:zinc ribbon domain-containing protein [Anaerolineales bacterium]